MARIARIVVPGIPHHVTQRGNRRQLTFFKPSDYQDYLEFLSQACRVYGVEIWAYCLMPNHIHLIGVPQEERSLRLALADTHARYTRMINTRNDWKGYLWQGRFFSCPMDEKHLYYAAKYVELNPVRSGLVSTPEAYQWSSAVPHIEGCDDILVQVHPLLARYPNWSEYLAVEGTEIQNTNIRQKSRSGRPLASDEFILDLEKQLGRRLRPLKRGRPSSSPNGIPENP